MKLLSLFYPLLFFAVLCGVETSSYAASNTECTASFQEAPNGPALIAKARHRPRAEIERDARAKVKRIRLPDGSNVWYERDSETGDVKGIRTDTLSGVVRKEDPNTISLALSDGRIIRLPAEVQFLVSVIGSRYPSSRSKAFGSEFSDEYESGEFEQFAWDSFDDWDDSYWGSDQYNYDFLYGLDRQACIQSCTAIAMAWLRACLLAGPAAPECMAAAEAFMIACTLLCELRY